jgi:AraC-like DNA-binding protein
VALIQILRWVVDHPDAAGVSHGLMRGLSDARLARTLVAMHQAPQDEWTLPRMAATAGMSRSAFAAVFKEVMQATPASLSAGLAAEPGLRAAAGRRGGQAGGDRGGVCRYRVVVEGVPQAVGGIAEGVAGRERRAGWVNG